MLKDVTLHVMMWNLVAWHVAIRHLDDAAVPDHARDRDLCFIARPKCDTMGTNPISPTVLGKGRAYAKSSAAGRSRHIKTYQWSTEARMQDTVGMDAANMRMTHGPTSKEVLGREDWG
jgi:hypothetical protein